MLLCIALRVRFWSIVFGLHSACEVLSVCLVTLVCFWLVHYDYELFVSNSLHTHTHTHTLNKHAHKRSFKLETLGNISACSMAQNLSEKTQPRCTSERKHLFRFILLFALGVFCKTPGKESRFSARHQRRSHSFNRCPVPLLGTLPGSNGPNFNLHGDTVIKYL